MSTRDPIITIHESNITYTTASRKMEYYNTMRQSDVVMILNDDMLRMTILKNRYGITKIYEMNLF